MTLGKSIQICFKKYAVFSGRASRSEYWWWQLFVFLLTFIVVFLVTIFFNEQAGNVCSKIIGLVLLLPNLAVAIRRCHDTNHSGWWVLCPIYNIVLMFTPSDPDANDYGTLED